MKMQFYADVYFILNLIMNLFLIMATALIRQKKCRFMRYVLWSALCAAGTVLVTYIWWEYVLWQLFAAIIQIGLFLRGAYGKEGWSVWAGDYICFLFLTFFTGGVIYAMRGILLRSFSWCLVHCHSIFWIIGAVAVLMVLFYFLRWELILQGQECKSIKTVTVKHRGIQVSVKALYDTGNQLVSPYTGEGVVIISEKLAQKLMLKSMQHPILIPYSSIGGNGLLEAYRLDCIQISDSICKKKVLAAVSGNLSDHQRIQMILNIT